MIKTFALAAAALSLSAACMAQADMVPAFPGAEGYARYTTTGGRGGTVVHVTNLNDSGTGSLRWALAQRGTKTIVFDVAGYIDLKSDLKMSSNTTIAGQTAPAPGITIRYYTLNMVEVENAIIRFIRVRRSQVKDVNDGADAVFGRRGKNVILDHCSFSWGIDETLSMYDTRNLTVQWCSASEGLNNSGHSKGAHGYGGIWGGKNASFHHNIIAHQNNRTPRLNSARYNWDGYDKTKFDNTVQAERVDLRNCVIYNWGQGNGAYGAMCGYTNIVNNYYKAGPGTKNKTRVFQCSKNASKDSNGAIPDNLQGRFYISGNYVTAAGSSAANYDWKGVITDGSKDLTFTDVKGFYHGKANEKLSIKMTEPIAIESTTTHDAETAFEKVLKYFGASLYRDEVDVRHAEEARTGTAVYKGTATKDGEGNAITKWYGGIIDLVNNPEAAEQDDKLVSFPVLSPASRPSDFDTDGDGMPDEWEKAHGLDPNDASDANAYTVDSKMKWYTNLECYINSLVEHIVKDGNADAVESVNEYFPGSTADFVPDEPRDIYSNPGRPYTAINPVLQGSNVVAIDYFTLEGKPIAEPAKGVSIRRFTYADGTSKADMVLKR